MQDEATVDASAKDYSLPVVDQAPAEFPPAEEQKEEGGTAAAEDGDFESGDKATFVKPFDRRRSTAPFSPSSGSDVSVVESEADTLAAQTPSRQPGDLDVDFISKFEKLVLNKQSSSDSIPPPEDNRQQEAPEEKEDPPAALNDTVPLESAGEDQDIPPGDATQDLARDIPSEASEQVNDEKPSEDLPPTQSAEETTSVPSSKSTEQLPSSKESEPETVEADATADQTVVNTGPAAEPNATDSSPVTEPEEPVDRLEEATRPISLPEEKPIVAKKGYDLSFLDRFDDLENATPSISHLPLLPPVPDNKNDEDDDHDCE